jgi:hypothetical protein
MRRHLIFLRQLVNKIHHFQSQPSTRSLSSLPALKKGSFFGLTLTFFPVLGFRPVYPPYFLTKKEQRPPNFKPIPLCLCLGHFIEKQGHDFFSFQSGQAVWIFQCLDEIDFVHWFEAPVIDGYDFEIVWAGIAGRINL